MHGDRVRMIQYGCFRRRFCMRLVTLEREGYAEPGVLSGGELIGIGGAGFDSVLAVIAGGADAIDRVGRWLKNPPAGEPFAPATHRPGAPVPRPPKIICIGLNYSDHAAETNLPIPETPTVFAKFQTAVTGHRHPIVLPKNSAKPDYEAEFAVVIGDRKSTRL